MAIITEDDVRKMLVSDNIGDCIYLEKNQIVTPSAKSYLTEHNITIKNKENDMVKNENQKFVTLFGAVLDEKPEHMTHLRGNILVFKNHPRIKFRGAIDSLESDIIILQTLTENQKLVNDLEEIINFIRSLIRCEVKDEDVGDFKLLGFDAPMLREYSHHPSKYYGISHFLPTHKHGEVIAKINRLRTRAREVELIAYTAFTDEYGECSRVDIVRALNRLSSLFWIMMFKCLKGEYGERAKGKSV